MLLLLGNRQARDRRLRDRKVLILFLDIVAAIQLGYLSNICEIMGIILETMKDITDALPMQCLCFC